MYVTSRQGYKPPVKSTGRGKKYSHFASLKYCNGAETFYTYDPQRGKAGGQMAHANTYGTDTGKKYVVFIKVFNMKYIITFAMCLFLMCSCDNHDFELSEKEQVFYINQMLHFSIEPWDSLSKAYSYDFFLRNPKPCKEVDTIYLERKIPNKFEVIESSSYTREYNRDPSFIKLLPNTQYIVAHTGMGARVNIFKYYYTDPFGKLHANDSLNEHINVDSIRLHLNR